MTKSPTILINLRITQLVILLQGTQQNIPENTLYENMIMQFLSKALESKSQYEYIVTKLKTNTF